MFLLNTGTLEEKTTSFLCSSHCLLGGREGERRGGRKRVRKREGKKEEEVGEGKGLTCKRVANSM